MPPSPGLFKAPGLLRVFPIEIVENILDQLCGQTPSDFLRCQQVNHPSFCRCDNGIPSTSRDLASLARTCRVLHALATRRLYRFPEFYSPDHAFLFARTLIARPDLASLVRTLQLDVFYNGRGTISLPWKVKEYYYKTKRGNIYRVPTWNRLQPDEILISLCPNIEIFESNDNFLLEPSLPLWTPDVLRCSKLKTVMLRHWCDGGRGLSLGWFSPLLYVAADTICSLNVHNLSECDINRLCSRGGILKNPARNLIYGARSLKKVTQIHLTCSTIDKRSLSNLLELCPNVQEIEYESGGSSPNWDTHTHQFSPAEAAAAVIAILDTHGSGDGGYKPLASLKKFSLLIRDDDESNDPVIEDDLEYTEYTAEVDAAVRALAERGIELVCKV